MSANYSGLVVAGLGFLLTRFTVSLAVHEEPLAFVLVGVLPLTLGLGLAAFGVALTVADVEASTVRTTALWCVVGTGAMFVLVVLTVVGSAPEAARPFGDVRSGAYLSNFLVGGAVGGTLTGLYASRNRRHRGALRRHANRLEVLNRLLRHEVLNAVAVIRGYATLPPADAPDAGRVIEERSDAIERTIEEVRHLTRGSEFRGRPRTSVDLETCLAESVATVRERHPDADVSVGPVRGSPTVSADERLSQVFVHLLENAVTHGSDRAPRVDDPPGVDAPSEVDDSRREGDAPGAGNVSGAESAPSIEVSTTGTSVRVAVTDRGPGLPGRARRLLETGDIEEFDDPTTGFGLNVVRLLVEGYRGRIETDVDDRGTTVTVVLPRADGDRGRRPSRAALAGVRPAAPHLAITVVAALVAGLVYGAVSEALGGSVAGIGVFYGVANPTVGWITHEFHSVVFAFAFVSLVAVLPERSRFRVGRGVDVVGYALLGAAWSVVVWLVAASLVAPVWLRLLGIDAPLPNLSAAHLASHLAWGLSLGALTALGYRHVAPRLDSLGDRLADGGGRRTRPGSGRS